jgi:hypothetical protein
MKDAKKIIFLLTADSRNCKVTHYASPIGYTYNTEEFATVDPPGFDQSC